MREKCRRGGPESRPPGGLLDALRLDQPGFQQQVDSRLAQRCAANLFDLRPRDGLILRNDGEHLHRRTRQPPRLLHQSGQLVSEIERRAELPASRDLDKVDPPPPTARLQRCQDLVCARRLGHELRHRTGRNRLGTGENEGLYEANGMLERVLHAERLPSAQSRPPAPMAPLRFALSAALKAKLQSGWEIDILWPARWCHD